MKAGSLILQTVPRRRPQKGRHAVSKELDRLPWKSGIAFTCHGACIGIRVNDASVLARLPAYLPPRWKAVDSPFVSYLYSLYVGEKGRPSADPEPHSLYAGRACIAQTPDLESVLDMLETSLHFTVAVGARTGLFVHAGVVGWRGQAILIPGRSMSGKTTLVAALVRAGATYYSDEYAVLDEHGRVHPFPRSLVMREGPEGRPRKYAVEALGGRAGTEPLPVGLIVATQYEPGAAWRPRVLSPGQAVLTLLDHTVLARKVPQRALTTFGRLTLRARTLQGKRGEADEVAATLLGPGCPGEDPSPTEPSP